MTVTLNVPQIIFIVLMIIFASNALLRLGESKPAYCYNWLDVLGPGLLTLLLWWGGFFGVRAP
jgi:hypothetical protein